jgi:putative endonuclease
MARSILGVTSDLVRRAWEHKQSRASGFTKRYCIHKLACHELCEDMLSAITREKQLKKWNREWKIRLIEAMNPYWNDLYDSIV